MFHKAVIDLLDVELERLRTARAMLLHTSFSLADTLLAEARQAPGKSRPAKDEPAPAQPVPARVQKGAAGKPRTRRGWSPERRERTLAARRGRPAEPRALANSVPAGPVAISPAALAEQKLARERRQAAGKVPAPSPQDDGSLEAMIRDLAKRDAG